MSAQNPTNDSTGYINIIPEENVHPTDRLARALNCAITGYPNPSAKTPEEVFLGQLRTHNVRRTNCAIASYFTSPWFNKRYNICRWSDVYRRDGLKKVFNYTLDDLESYVKLEPDQIPRTELRKLKKQKPCCQFYRVYRTALAPLEVSGGECVECYLKSRLDMMHNRYSNWCCASRTLYKYGPIDEDTLVLEADTCFTTDHYPGDVVKGYGYKTPDTYDEYVVIPLQFLSHNQLSKFIRMLRNKWNERWARQMTMDPESLALLRGVVSRRYSLSQLRSHLRTNHPQRPRMSVEKIYETWQEIRQDLSDFDLQSYYDSLANTDLAYIRDKYRKCARTRCIREAVTPGGYCIHHNIDKPRPTGEAQFFNPTVNFPQEVLDMLRRLSNPAPFDVNVNFGLTPESQVNWMQATAAIGSFLTLAYKVWPCKVSLMAAFTQLVLSLRLDTKLINALISSFNTHIGLDFSCFSGTPPPQDSPCAGRSGPAQADGSMAPDSILLFAVTTGVSLISALAVGRLPPNGSFMNFLKNVGTLGRASSGISEFQTRTGNLLASAMEYIRTKILNYPSSNELAGLDAFCDEVLELKNGDFEKNIKNNLELKEKVDSLIIRGDNLLKFLDKLRVPLNQRQRITGAVAYLNLLRSASAGSGAGCTEPRVAPIIAHIVGASGVGKSSILWLLIARILAGMGCTSPQDINEKVYFKYPTRDERWDGFSNQTKIVVCDDVFSRRDSEANPSPEVIETIRMSNTAFWQLTMAHLNDKGTTFFKAPVVLWTSNQHSFVFDSITNPEAVQRRVTVRYRQKPAPEYATQQRQGNVMVDVLDQDKIYAQLATDPTLITKVVLFDKEVTTFGSRVVLKANMTFDEVADEINTLNLQNIARFETFDDAVKKFFIAEVARQQQARNPTPPTDQPSTSQPTGPAQLFTTDNYETTPPNMTRNDFENSRCVFFEKEGYIQRSHLDIWSSANSLYRLDFPAEQIDRPVHSYNYRIGDTDYHLSELTCVKLRNARYASSFVKAWATAFYVMRNVSPSGIDLTGREVFDAVFFKTSNIPPGLIQPCPDHTLPYWRQTCARKFKEWDATYSPIITQWITTHLIWLAANGDSSNPTPYTPFVIMGFGIFIASLMTIAHWLARLIWSMCTRTATSLKETTIDTVRKVKSLVLSKERLSAEYEKLSLKRGLTPEDIARLKKHHTIEELWLAADKIERDHNIDQYTDLVCEYGNTVAGRTKTPVATHRTSDLSVEYGDSTRGRERVRRTKGIVEMVLDHNAESLGPIMYRNLYRLEYFDGINWKHCLHMLFVRGRVAICNRHVFIKEDETVWRLRNMHTTTPNFNLWSCKSSYNNTVANTTDLVAFEMPVNIPQHPDIVRHFMRDDDLARFNTLNQVCLMTYNDKTAMKQMYTSAVERVDDMFTLTNNYQPVGTLSGFYQYGIQTSPGDCGSPLIAFDKNFERKIMGIHSAGQNCTDYQGIGQPVTQEMVIDHLSQIHYSRSDSLMYPDLSSIAASEVEMELNGTDIVVCERQGYEKFTLCGQTQGANSVPGRTNIRPSRLHGVIAKPLTKPAYLRAVVINHERIDPMVLARRKAAGYPEPMNTERLDACVYNYAQKINRNKLAKDQQVFSFETAIKGVVGDECVPPLNRLTSAGFGWPKLGKHHWLGKEENYVTDHPDVLRKRAEIMDSLVAGNRPTTVWQDVLKDERRPIEKVDSGKTRMFSVGEMVFVIIFRQYFGGFIAHVMRNRIANEICVGANPFSMDWTKIGRALTTHGKHVIAGDFSNYDGTLNADILWRVLDLINDFYHGTDQETTIRTALWSEIVNSIHQCDSTLYMWNHSNPSGCPITTILNSVYHCIAARYVFLTCAVDVPGCYDLSLFHHKVRHFNYGDDDVWNIHPDIIGWFNQSTMTTAFATFGMTYTDELKTGEIVASRRLEEVRFLKRSFRWDELQHRFRAPISLDTIDEMAMWVRGKVDCDRITSITLEEAVHELAQYDKKTFDRELPRFESARQIIDKFVPTVFHNYKHYQEIEMSRWCDGTDYSG